MSSAEVVGPHLRALVALVREWDRKKVDRETLAVAKQTASPELRALFGELAGRTSEWGISVEEYQLDERDIGEIVPSPSYSEHDGFDDGKVVIGHSPGGDLFVVELEPTGKKAPVWRMAHDEAWTPYREADSLERFLAKRIAAVKASDPDDAIVVALAKAKREKPVVIVESARPAAAPKPKPKVAKKPAPSTNKMAWRPAQWPKTTTKENKAIVALEKRHKDAFVLDAKPDPVVVSTDRRGTRVAIAKGSRLVPLKVPVLHDLRWALSPSGKSLLVGSPLRLFHVDLSTGKVQRAPDVGWYDSVAFVDDSLFVVAAKEEWRQPQRTSETNELLAKYRTRGKDVWLRVAGGVHAIAVGANGAMTVVQRLDGSAEEVKSFFGRLVVVRKPKEHGEREDPLDARTSIYVVKSDRLVFVGSLSKDPGTLFDVNGRLFGDDGYELVGFDAAAGRVGDTPATRVPFETTTNTNPEPLPPVLGVALGKKAPKPKGGPKAAPSALRAIGPSFRHAWNADGRRCLAVFMGKDEQEQWEVVGGGKPEKVVLEDAFFNFEDCAYLGDYLLFAMEGHPIGDSVEYGIRKGKKKMQTKLLSAGGGRFFSVKKGRFVVTGAPTNATYMGYTSSVLALVKGEPAVIGTLPHGVTNAWDADGKVLVEATDGKTYEVALPVD